MLFPGAAAQGAGSALRDLQEVHGLLGQGNTLVQLGEVDDIVHQGHQPGRLPVDQAGKVGDVLRLHQPVFQQLRAAQDGLQRRFQLVGHVGGELPAAAFGTGPLRHVEGQQNHPHRSPLRLDSAQVELVFPAATLGAHGAAALLQGGADGIIHRLKDLPF